MNILSLPINRLWQIKLPTVIRYMEQQYIDLFFDTGKLRLSSFRRFAKHEDELRQDAGEGMAGMQLNYAEGQTMAGFGWFGQEAYIFCTSTIESRELMEKFETNGYFRIKDTKAFGAAVSNHVAGYLIGYEGACLYREARMMTASFNRPLIVEPPSSDATEEQVEAWADNLERQMHEDVQLAPYFLKPLRYAEQNEYRFIWQVQKRTEEYLDITCPEAVQFC